MCALARAEASLGEVARARSLATDAIGFGGFVEHLWGRAALGFVELTDDAPERAIAPLELVADFARVEHLRLLSPAPWGPDLVEAYVLTGRLDDARALVQRLGDGSRTESDGVDAWCSRAMRGARRRRLRSPIPRRRSRRRRCCRFRSRSRGRDSCYGERLLAAGRSSDAAAELWRAHEMFARLGAACWARRAERGLASCGQPAEPSRPPALAVLTPKEYQVAAMIADGASNRERREQPVPQHPHRGNPLGPGVPQARYQLPIATRVGVLEGTPAQLGATERAIPRDPRRERVRPSRTSAIPES